LFSDAYPLSDTDDRTGVGSATQYCGLMGPKIVDWLVSDQNLRKSLKFRLGSAKSVLQTPYWEFVCKLIGIEGVEAEQFDI